MTEVREPQVVNKETIGGLLKKLATRGLSGAMTVVLDNARYQRNAVVQALAASLGIELLYLPSYSPNLNLIERLWRFVKRGALYGRYHPAFSDFHAPLPRTLSQLCPNHKDQLASLMP